MKRIDFLRKLGLGTMVLPLGASCGNGDDPALDDGACTTSPSETAGPFPTKDPASLIIQDIRVDRRGIVMDIQIAIQNKSNGCAPLSGVLVDVWHCDKDGYYSEYGGTGMQSVNLQNVHFLRGRQTTNAQGVATFRTIFPGWYPGRAPHVHVEVLDTSERSLLVTQIAFPTDLCDQVYTTATDYYTNGKQDTSNSRDGIFRDSISAEMPVVTGSIAAGFTLTHKIVVNG
jgi:protocatechuate 3,4-dioxygenase beta subunit